MWIVGPDHLWVFGIPGLVFGWLEGDEGFPILEDSPAVRGLLLRLEIALDHDLISFWKKRWALLEC
jgi:hypothetical protein